jgi:hypothetical protein
VELPDDMTGAHMRLDYRDGILFVRVRNRNQDEEEEIASLGTFFRDAFAREMRALAERFHRAP